MRSTVFAALALLAATAAPLAGALAQDTAAHDAGPKPAAKHAEPTTGPKKPIPYAQLVAKPKPKPKPPADAATPPAKAAVEPAQAGAAKPAAAKADAAKPDAADELANEAQASAPPPAPAAPSAPGARLAPGQPAPPAELAAFVDGVVRQAMVRDHIAGVTVAVVQNGQVVLKRGYGFASLNPDRAVDPDRTLFRIGSVSKTFTWIAVMKEVEAGRIRLNQPVNLYLPEKAQVKDQGYDQPVRVANLMDHSAGFEDRTLGQLFERDFNRVRPLDLYLRQERPRRVHAPGAVSSYSNFGAALAGEAASYTAGKPYERLVEDEILTPLGMAHTTFREPHPAKPGLPAPMPANLAADVSDGYRWTPLGFRKRDFEYVEQVAPAAAGSSTAGDMARYMLMMLGGGQWNGATVYGATTAQAFRTPLRKTPPGINGWAHGLIMHELPGGHMSYGHGGGTLSFFSYLSVVPDLDLGVFVATNTDTGGALTSQLPAAVVGEFYAPPPAFPRPGSPELADRAGEFAGRYVSTRRAYSGLEGFISSLRSAVTIGVTPEGRLTDSDGGVWVPDGPLEEGRFVGAANDQHLAFDLRDGRAESFVDGGGAALFQRVPFWRRPSVLASLAVLTALAAVATLGGLAVRNRREFRENQIQSRASLVQNIQAALWLAAMALFGLWVSKTGDTAAVMYSWPGFDMVIASACALVAAGLTAMTFIALPAIWRGGRRVDSWSPLRKAALTFTVLVYLAFAAELGLMGALSPWNT